jgi:hypothetical protein
MDYKKQLQQTRKESDVKAQAAEINAVRPAPAIGNQFGTPLLPEAEIDEAAELMVREQFSKGIDPVTIYSAIRAVFKLSEAQATAIIDRVRLGGTPEWKNAFVFWAGSGNKASLQVDEHNFIMTFMAGRGYRRHLPGQVSEGFVLVQIIDNIIYDRNMGHVKSDTFAFLKTLPVQVSVNDQGTFRHEISRAIMKNERGLFSMGKAEFLPDLPDRLLVDTWDRSYFVYLNGWIEVTKSGVSELKPHSQLPGLVWSGEVIQRNFVASTVTESMSSRFIDLISGKDKDRAFALKSAIGYLLHRYKNPALNKAVILMDEQVSTDPNGGTGKSLIGRMVAAMRGVLVIDGRSFKPDKSFLFQRYRSHHSVINFDDVHQWFDLGFIYVTLTQGLTVERKGRDEVMTDYSQTPKILVSTNFVVGGTGQSSERRRVDLEFAPHFNAKHQPKDEFGKQFFTDWTPEEWGQFDSFMASCVQIFLTEGLIQPAGLNQQIRALIQATHVDFPKWIEDYLNSLPDEGNGVKKAPKKDMYFDWLGFAGWGEKDLSEKRWRRWLDAYQRYSGLVMEEERVAIGQRERRWIFKKSVQDPSSFEKPMSDVATNSIPDDKLPF